MLTNFETESVDNTTDSHIFITCVLVLTVEAKEFPTGKGTPTFGDSGSCENHNLTNTHFSLIDLSFLYTQL